MHPERWRIMRLTRTKPSNAGRNILLLLEVIKPDARYHASAKARRPYRPNYNRLVRYPSGIPGRDFSHRPLTDAGAPHPDGAPVANGALFF